MLVLFKQSQIMWNSYYKISKYFTKITLFLENLTTNLIISVRKIVKFR